jgi:hypothetical protein
MVNAKWDHAGSEIERLLSATISLVVLMFTLELYKCMSSTRISDLIRDGHPPKLQDLQSTRSGESIIFDPAAIYLRLG